MAPYSPPSQVDFSSTFANLSVEQFGPPQQQAYCAALLRARAIGDAGATCTVTSVSALGAAGRRRLEQESGAGIVVEATVGFAPLHLLCIQTLAHAICGADLYYILPATRPRR